MDDRIKVRTLSDHELDKLYGKRKTQVGKAFRAKDGHYYLQRDSDVLHVGFNLVNSLHVGFFNDTKLNSLVEVSEQEFTDRLRQVAFDMNVFQFFISK